MLYRISLDKYRASGWPGKYAFYLLVFLGGWRAKNHENPLVSALLRARAA